jgi:hypothetical protein
MPDLTAADPYLPDGWWTADSPTPDVTTDPVVQQTNPNTDASSAADNYDPAPTAADILDGKTPDPTAFENFMSRIKTNGVIDFAKAATMGLGVLAAARAVHDAINPPRAGYQGGIPAIVASRAQLPQQTQAAPGAMGHRYFTDTQYSTPSGLPAAQAAVQAQATQMQQPVAPTQAPAAPVNYDAFFGRTPQQVAQAPQLAPQNLAHGGVAGRYLQGPTDGMADKLPTTIDHKQPAALSHGEFVIPADVVSHLGNGNSDAGAKQLYDMMARIRKARTGTAKQGKEIDPNKFVPGGLAHAYAVGGSVRGYATGDLVTGSSGTSSLPPGTVGTEQDVSNWAGPYVSNMLAQGQALANSPYQAYQGQLTAGPSGLQQQAFGEAGALQTPQGIGQAADAAGAAGQKLGGVSYDPSSPTFGVAQAQQYMNPYLQMSLNPQLAEARRQSDITGQNQQAQMTQAGAFGGGRQAIMASENARNLGTNLANITAQGYNTAYGNAQQQFNADSNRAIGQQQFGANLGLQGLQGAVSAATAQGQLGALQNQTGLANINAQAGLGATQQGITQAGLTADQAAFTAERDNPYKMVQYQQSLLQGLPLAANNYITNTNPYTIAAGTLNNATGIANPSAGAANTAINNGATTPPKA